MKRIIPFLAVAIAASLLAACGSKNDTHKLITPVNFSDVTIDDGFWSPRLQSHKDVTLKVCIDQIENQTGRIRNFENAAKGEGEHSGIYFDDSDVYKALEGMAYSLQNNPDPELEAKCDEWIDKFAAAQEDDGYINTYYTLTGLENRWSDMGMHEMYCAGHLTEAAVAYYNVTGKRKLLDVAIRMADYMMTVFGPGKRDWVPGHEEIELALVKLYQVTGEKKYLDFAEWLIEERGNGHGTWVKWRTEAYYQDDKPVREMTSIAGHAVRAMYLYCGMADVAAYTGDQGYMNALDSLWEDVVMRNMYVTGGIGQSARNEGFTTDYSLPNLTAYCETCASVGMVLWNWRMNQFTGDAKYIDVLERSLYNGALAGISLDGDRFFYVNPLESLGTHHRQAWYGCACCPSQICRFLPSIGNYIYGVSDDALWVNLFLCNEAKVKIGGKTVTVSQDTGYPWRGDVRVTLNMRGSIHKDIRIRIPAWCKDYFITVNGNVVDAPVDKGYAVLSGRWRDGDIIYLEMEMPAELVAAAPRVKEDEGRRAVQRGPLVYCMEEVDNPAYADLRLEKDARFDEVWENYMGHVFLSLSTTYGDQAIKLIPYYAWDNRDPGRMQVWIPLAGE